METITERRILWSITSKNGDKVTFRPETREDVEKVWELYSTLSVSSRLFLPPFERSLIDRWSESLNQFRFPPILAVIPDEGKRVVGRAILTLNESDSAKHRAEFGVVVHDDYQDQGIGTELTRHMINVAKEGHIMKITLEVFSENARAIHVYEKCGFHVEGLLKNHYFFHNRYYEVVLMGLILI